jgi:hypothetical protein
MWLKSACLSKSLCSIPGTATIDVLAITQKQKQNKQKNQIATSGEHVKEKEPLYAVGMNAD